MSEQTETRKSLVELANKSADQFANGKVINGLGILGVLLTLSAALTLLFPDIFGEKISEIKQQFALLCGVNGAAFTTLSALLYSQKSKMKHEISMTLTAGYFRVTTELVTKVKSGTVLPEEIQSLAQSYFASALTLISDESNLPKLPAPESNTDEDAI